MTTPTPAQPVPPAPPATAHAPAPAPVPMISHSTFVIVVSILATLVVLGAGTFMLFRPPATTLTPLPTVVRKAAPTKKAVAKSTPAPVVIHNYNVQSAELPKAPPAPTPSITIYNYNIQGPTQPIPATAFLPDCAPGYIGRNCRYVSE